MSKKRIISLDGIRGIAVLLVMLLHAHFQFGKGGAIGVDIFFVLSGFLITNNLLEEYDISGKVSIKNFWIKRFLRLVPAFFILLIFVFIIGLFISDKGHSKAILIETRDALLYLSNISWLWTEIGYERILGHTWSLSVEQQFYFIWPLFICFFIRHIKKKYFFIIIVFFFSILSAYKQFGNAPEVFKSFYFESIFIGCLVAISVWNKWFITIESPLIPFFALILILYMGLFGFEFYSGLISIKKYLFLLIPLLSVILLIHSYSNNYSIINKILSFKPLVFTGTISYGLYLWHIPVFRLFKWYSLFPPSVSFILKFAVTFSIATLSYFLFEKKVLKFSKKIVHN